MEPTETGAIPLQESPIAEIPKQESPIVEIPKRGRGRPALSEEEKARRAAIREEAKRAIANRVDILPASPEPAKPVRPPPSPEKILEMRGALVPTFQALGRMGMRIGSRGLESPIPFPDADAESLAKAWAPILAKYLDNLVDVFLWSGAIATTVIVVESSAGKISAQKKAEAKSKEPKGQLKMLPPRE